MGKPAHSSWRAEARKAKGRSQTAGRDALHILAHRGPGLGFPLFPHGCRGGRLTSAVGKRGTANCSSPATWICIVVSERWKMVSAWARRDHSPAVRSEFPGAPAAPVPWLRPLPLPASAAAPLTMACPACRSLPLIPQAFEGCTVLLHLAAQSVVLRACEKCRLLGPMPDPLHGISIVTTPRVMGTHAGV